MTRQTSNPRCERGAVLIVALILLLVMTVLAVATMGTASLELAMAGNTQSSQNAFQLAETGIDVSIAVADNHRETLVATPGAPPTCTGTTTVPGVGTYQACTSYTDEVTPMPGTSAALGTGLAAYHFVVTSEGRSFRDARAVHVQNFYVPGPAGGQ